MLMASSNQYRLLQNESRASSDIDVTWSDQVLVSLGKIFIYEWIWWLCNRTQ